MKLQEEEESEKKVGKHEYNIEWIERLYSAEFYGRKNRENLCLHSNLCCFTSRELIAMIVFKTKTSRKPVDLFIVNMAMSDLLYPIFLFPSELTKLYVDSWLIRGPLGQALCKLHPFIADASRAVSVQSLVLIAVDRVGAVVFPLRYPLISSKMCHFFILVTWIVAMSVYSPYLFALKLVDLQKKLYCEMRWNEDFRLSSSPENYFLAVIVIFFHIPIALVIILYSIIFTKIKSQKIPGEQSLNADQRRERRNRKVLKMAIVIVLGFTLCWLPFSIITLRRLFARDSRLVDYWSITRILAFSNCAINPCICFVFNGNYRRGLKRLFKCFDSEQE